jgi:hypothetical protein
MILRTDLHAVLKRCWSAAFPTKASVVYRSEKNVARACTVQDTFCLGTVHVHQGARNSVDDVSFFSDVMMV